MAHLANTPFVNWPAVRYAELIKLDRLAPRVHLVKLADDSETRMVAKYASGDPVKGTIWKEMNILGRQQLHPSILPVECIILDENDCVIGMGTKFIPGGDLLRNKDRVFKLKWLQQLTEALDFLHFKQGIVHGDLHLGSILIDEAADRLVLCDFSRAREATQKNLMEEFWGAMWTLYELITLDFQAEEQQVQKSYAKYGEYSLDTESIEKLPSWPVRTKLDCDVEILRSYMREWLKKRVETLQFVEPKEPDPMEILSRHWEAQCEEAIHGCQWRARTIQLN
ncbi:kinase-like domain-containing protein [Daldinia bambusicola]|nr:kinase-like domain-containing protein [Daldinia bambusicola]